MRVPRWNGVFATVDVWEWLWYYCEGIDGQLIPDGTGMVGGGLVEAVLWSVVVLL